MLYSIEDKDIGTRLDIYLSNNLNEYTRSYIKKLIEDNEILVNDKSVKSGYSLKLNDKILIKDIKIQESDIIPKKIDIDIIYEDDDIIIINKEKGMTVHPGSGNYTDTLVNSLLYTHKDKLSTINSVVRPGIVHRIDKDTTGILVVAKNDNAHKRLSEQFKEHTIKREYIALVKGILKEDNIIVDQPIGRSTKDRKKMCITDKNSRNAVTHITVLNRFYNSKITLIKAVLETGRTHQIRVHMKYLGYPLLGDLTYGSESKQFKVKGHLLHARLLGFIHPSNNNYVEFESKLPEEFQSILNTLENREKN
ncbi:MAG: pseudouridine synthase, RluA family [Clostridia bacterium]|jgi:23S rRNA pseudouridine1911/1915/1917 synthase|nr:pseudouridine synthase, RluA family [Clostridia bacterium]